MIFKEVLWWSYMMLSLVAVVVGLFRWRIAEKPVRIFVAVLGITLLVETGALIYAFQHYNNIFIYHIFTPLELLGYCIYFQMIDPQLRRWQAGWVLGGGGIATAVLFEGLYPEDITGTRFLMLECVTIICLCLYTFYRMMLHDDEEPPTRNIHFWLVASLTFFWCMSFLSLSLYDAGNAQFFNRNLLLQRLIHIGNIGMYTGVILSLIYLPKLQSWKTT